MRTPGALAIMLVVVLGLLLPADAAAFTVPAGFSDGLVVNGLGLPTAIDWLPTGEMLIATQAGILYRWDGTAKQAILDLTSTTCLGGETGLLGVAVDPAFETNQPFIYLYYTHRQGPNCEAANRANRVSRFPLDGNGTVGNEQVLIDHMLATGGNHNAGDLQFDTQGLLYVSVGEAGTPANARRLDVLNGKILRITRSGGIPDTNPFLGPGTVSCSATGHAQAGTARQETVTSQRHGKHHKRHQQQQRKRHKRHQRRNTPPPGENPTPSPTGTVCQEIFATGLRNPFRIAFDPNDGSGQQRFFINDVGQSTWEEIDDGQAGADYGWPVREGPCPMGATTGCTPDPQFVDPIFAYDRSADCTVITGGAFVPQSADWPTAYDNVYLFADLHCATIFALRNESPGQHPEPFATGTGAVHLRFGPGKALYYTTFDGGGQVRSITPPA